MAASKATAATRARPNPLGIFVWEGTDKRGTKMKGETTSKNANLVRAELRKQGINPTVVKDKAEAAVRLRRQAHQRAGDRHLQPARSPPCCSRACRWCRASRSWPAARRTRACATMLLDIRDSVSGGSTLYEALGRHPVQFDDLYRNLVKAGEGAGVLDTVLDTLATYKERIEALKGKIKKALFYPVGIMAIAVLVSSILLIFVVPQFEEVFANFGAELPAFTQMYRARLPLHGEVVVADAAGDPAASCSRYLAVLEALAEDARVHRPRCC